MLLRLGVFLHLEERLPQAKLKLRQHVVHAQEALDPVGLLAVGRHDQEGRGPLRSEALECLRLFLDVDLRGDEVRADEVNHPLVRIDLGFQPSTSASLRCGAEIQKCWFPLVFRGL